MNDLKLLLHDHFVNAVISDLEMSAGGLEVAVAEDSYTVEVIVINSRNCIEAKFGFMVEAL
jgi:hypothetical protein